MDSFFRFIQNTFCFLGIFRSHFGISYIIYQPLYTKYYIYIYYIYIYTNNIPSKMLMEFAHQVLKRDSYHKPTNGFL